MELLGSEKKEKNEIELSIGITPEELEAAINKAYLKNKNRIAVPGFRKGKAPRKIIEKMYGKAMFINDAFDILLPDVYKFAMEDTEFDVVGYPKVTDVEMKDDNTRAEVKVSAALRPEVKLGKYKGLSAPRQEVEVSDSEVDREVEAMRERNARLESVERPAAMGDVTIIDFEGFLDGKAFEGGKGENYELELGSGRFIPGFEEKIVGMNVGDERDIDLVFPEQYKEDLAGKPVVFKVKLQELKEKQLPELDDDFAMDVSEFDTLDEYKASIKERILKGREDEATAAFEEGLMEKLIEELDVEVPDAMVDEQADKNMQQFSRNISAYGMNPAQYMQMTGMNPEAVREQMHENAGKQVKTALALDEIAKLEGVEVSDEELEEELKKSAEELKIELDELKEKVDSDIVLRDMKRRRAAKIVIDSAKAEKVKNEKKEKNKENEE